MPIQDDGDLIRAYGFVAVYFATLEESVDDRLSDAAPLLSTVEPQPAAVQIEKKRFAEKAKILTKALSAATQNGHEEKANVEKMLDSCITLAAARNDILHSPIIADLRTREVIRNSKRTGYATVSSSDVYKLAQSIHALASEVYSLHFLINELCGRPRFLSR